MQQSALTEFLHSLRLRMAHTAMHGAGDRQLLEKFQIEADDAAFAVLVQRYGPMVLAVCRRVLGHEHEAEDAFQATFLVLVRKAAAIRKRESLASWLHGVAHRIAVKAYGRQARRRGVEEKAAQPVEQPEMDPTTWNELRLVLDEEIQRLPNKLRVPLVLCALQGKTHEQAAAELGCHRSSVTAWLAQANELLCKRLTKRGMQLTPALLAGILAEKTAVAALPGTLLVATVRLATVWAAGETVVAGSISTGAITLAKEALKGMLAMKVKLVLTTASLALVVAGAGVAGYHGLGGFDPSAAETRENARVVDDPRTNGSGKNAAEQAKPKDDQPRLDLHGDALPLHAIARLGQDRWLHGVFAKTASFMPDGKSVITTCDDGTIRIFEFPSGKEIRRIAGPPGKSMIDAVGQSIDHKTVALLFQDGPNQIFLVDIAGGTKLPVLDLPQDRGAPVFSPDGVHLATLAKDGTVRIWDWATGKEVFSFPTGDQTSSAALRRRYLPDGKALVTGMPLTGKGKSGGCVVKLWDPATGDLIRTLYQKSDGSGLDLALSTDGKMIAITSGGSPAVTLVEVATGKEIRRLESQEFRKPSTMIFNKDDTKLYAVADVGPGKVVVEVVEWDIAIGKVLRTCHVPHSIQQIAPQSLSPDGNALVIAGSGPQVFDLSAGKEITVINQLTFALGAVQFLPDGKRLLTKNVPDLSSMSHPRSTASLQKWDAVTGKNLGPLSSSLRLASAVSPDGIIDSSFCWDGAASPDGKVVAGFVLEAKVIPFKNFISSYKLTMMDLDGGKMLGQHTVASSPNHQAMTFSPDGKTLALRDYEGNIGLYEVPSAKLLCMFNEKAPREAIVIFSGSGHILPAPVFSPDGKILAASADPKTIDLWDTTNGRRIVSLPRDPVLGFLEREPTFSPDGRCLALAKADGTTVFYELASLKVRGTLGKPPDLPNGKARFCISFSPDGKSIAHAGYGGSVNLWDILTWQKLTEFKGHADVVNALAFAPDGKTLASASDDSTAMIWGLSKIKRPVLPVKALQRGDIEKSWQVLAGNDAEKAWAAMRDLVAAPKDGVGFIKERVKPATPLDVKLVEKLIGQLDDAQFKTRETAIAELRKRGDQIVPSLKKALAANPTLQAKQSLEKLRGELTGMILHDERLRAYRAIEVLELIATPEARQVLQALANGAPGALVTTSAHAALTRLNPK